VFLEGYTIPEGWTVMICPLATHLNPITYTDPNHSIHGDGRFVKLLSGSKCWPPGNCILNGTHVLEVKLKYGHVQDISEPVGGSKDFLVFGLGLRSCLGADFAKLQIATFLHCLVTNYRYYNCTNCDLH